MEVAVFYGDEEGGGRGCTSRTEESRGIAPLI